MTHPNYTPPPGIREPRRRSRLPYAALAAAVILLGVILANECWGAAEALVEPDDERRTHIVVVCPPAEPCKPRGRAISKTACEMDLRGVAIVVASGTRTRCERVK